MKNLFALVACSTLSAFLLLACGPPSIEEACADYCEWAEAADCGGVPAECSVGCDNIRDALELVGQEDCIDQYAALFDCASSSDHVCLQGTAIPTDGCTEEARDLIDCIGVLNDD
jgi:hypothetical protein